MNPIARGGPFWTPITPQRGPFSTLKHIIRAEAQYPTAVLRRIGTSRRLSPRVATGSLIGAEQSIPEKVDDREIAIRVQVMDETPMGWAGVQAICDFVHKHLAFNMRIPARAERRGRRSKSSGAYAATMRTWGDVLSMHEHARSLLRRLSG